MCNEYARAIAMEKLIESFSHLKLPKFEWRDHQIPNDLTGKESVKIRDTAPIIRLEGSKLSGAMTTWAWPGPRGKPVFNFVAEGRSFADSDRVLIPATGFYEYTIPTTPKVKLKDKHLFTMKGEPWFWIAGIVKNDCFTMLTTAPGEDVAPYHDRQIVTLPPAAAMQWLKYTGPIEIVRTPPGGTFVVKTRRKDGRDI